MSFNGFTKRDVEALNATGRTGRRKGVGDRHRARCRRIDDLAAFLLCQRGNSIRSARDEAGVSISELAEACGVGVACVARWESGASFPVWRLFQIAYALNVPVDHLVRTR